MTQQAVETIRILRGDLLGVLETLGDDEWRAPSGCSGWRVQEVVTHMGWTFQLFVDPAAAQQGSPPDAGVEDGADAAARARAGWSPTESLAYYTEMSEKGIEALAGLQAEGIAEMEQDLGDLGTHPLHLLADAIAFDHWTHLHLDLLSPGGPIDRPEPPTDDVRLRPAIEWLIAGLPQMCTPALAPVNDRPWVLRLEGPGGGTWSVLPAEGDRACRVDEGATTEAVATVTTPTTGFVAWSTKRRPWRDEVVVEGDDVYATRVLDAIKLI